MDPVKVEGLKNWPTPTKCYITVGTFTQRGLGSAKQQHWVVCSGFCL